MQRKSQIQTRQLTAVKNSSCQQYSAQSGFGLTICKPNRLSGKAFEPADGSTQNLGNALATNIALPFLLLSLSRLLAPSCLTQSSL